MSEPALTALVTGSSRGIGRAVALKLAEQGARIAIHFNVRRDAAEQTLEDVRAHGGDGVVVQADLTDEASATSMLTSVGEQLGGELDVLVHSARPELEGFYQPTLQLTPASLSTAVDSQALAFLLAGQAAAKRMRDGGRIVAVTYSPGTRTGSWQPWAGMGAAKAAMEALVRYVAVALAPRGITVNAVSPGWVTGEPGTLGATVFDGLPEEVGGAIRDWHLQGWTPMGRLATPDDIADAVLLLCDERARFVTGQVVHVDGGASVMDPLAPLPIQQP